VRRSDSTTSINRTITKGAVIVALITGVLFIGTATASVASTTGGGNLTVDVTDEVTASPSPTPSPSASIPRPASPVSPPSTPSINPGPAQAPVTSQPTQATIPNPQTADDALGADATSTGEMLTMSGLSVTAEPSFAIGNGSLVLSFVVRNTWREPMSLSARFWVDNLIGMRLADVADVQVADLQPDETRRVQVRIDGLGQHIVLRNYVTLTPPTSVGGAELDSMTRNTMIVVPPLFTMSVVGGLAAVGGLVWWLVARQGWAVSFWRLGRWA
jgi:hypothetical protein